MTEEQLSNLRKMTKGEIARKYTKMLISKQISREQYDWLISQGKETIQDIQNKNSEIKSNESFDTISQFTTHDDEVMGRTQTKRLANLLSDGEWHPNTEILEKVAGAGHSGRLNIPARKYDLIQAGYEIEYVHKHGSVWEMRMVRAPAAEKLA